MNRYVEPELLDSLAPEDPEARRSREDLHVINGLMGNCKIVANAVTRLSPPQPFKRVLELGAGDGRFLLRLQMLPSVRERFGKADVFLLDRSPALESATRKHLGAGGRQVHVIQEDVFCWLKSEPELQFDLVFANLFVHHFSTEAIQTLFRILSQRTNCFVACEPQRSKFALKASALLWILRCNPVTRHDAPVSVRAGFLGSELSHCWPQEQDWTTEEVKKGLFSHLFSARRRRWL